MLNAKKLDKELVCLMKTKKIIRVTLGMKRTRTKLAIITTHYNSDEEEAKERYKQLKLFISYKFNMTDLGFTTYIQESSSLDPHLFFFCSNLFCLNVAQLLSKSCNFCSCYIIIMIYEPSKYWCKKT